MSRFAHRSFLCVEYHSFLLHYDCLSRRSSLAKNNSVKSGENQMKTLNLSHNSTPNLKSMSEMEMNSLVKSMNYYGSHQNLTHLTANFQNSTRLSVKAMNTTDVRMSVSRQNYSARVEQKGLWINRMLQSRANKRQGGVG